MIEKDYTLNDHIIDSNLIQSKIKDFVEKCRKKEKEEYNKELEDACYIFYENLKKYEAEFIFQNCEKELHYLFETIFGFKDYYELNDIQNVLTNKFKQYLCYTNVSDISPRCSYINGKFHYKFYLGNLLEFYWDNGVDKNMLYCGPFVIQKSDISNLENPDFVKSYYCRSFEYYNREIVRYIKDLFLFTYRNSTEKEVLDDIDKINIAITNYIREIS